MFLIPSVNYKNYVDHKKIHFFNVIRNQLICFVQYIRLHGWNYCSTVPISVDSFSSCTSIIRSLILIFNFLDCSIFKIVKCKKNKQSSILYNVSIKNCLNFDCYHFHKSYTKFERSYISSSWIHMFFMGRLPNLYV